MASFKQQMAKKHKYDLIGVCLISVCLTLLGSYTAFAYYHDSHSDKYHNTHYLN